jgi:hypothetical protein
LCRSERGCRSDGKEFNRSTTVDVSFSTNCGAFRRDRLDAANRCPSWNCASNSGGSDVMAAETANVKTGHLKIFH